jgi:hypothetical protein
MRIYVDSTIYEIFKLSVSVLEQNKAHGKLKIRHRDFQTLHKYIYERLVAMETWKGLEVKFLK